MSFASALNGGGEMMIAEEYMSRSRLFQRLKNGSHDQANYHLLAFLEAL